jgi:hypothetical protein
MTEFTLVIGLIEPLPATGRDGTIRPSLAVEDEGGVVAPGYGAVRFAFAVGMSPLGRRRRMAATRERVQLDLNRAFPFRLYGPSRPATTAGGTGAPSVLADAEEDGGSTPPAPTTGGLTRPFVRMLARS